MLRILCAAACLSALFAFAAPAAGGPAAGSSIKACALIKVAELKKVLGSPASIRRGATAAGCVFRAGQYLPVVAATTAKGKRGYDNIVRAAGRPLARVPGIGTEAVSYDHLLVDPAARLRGVIVRKKSNVIHLSSNGIGDDPGGLPTVAQLVALARFAAARL